MADEIYAIVSLFGHHKIAGRISEFNLGGTFVRVDVPAVNGNQPFTKLFGPSAIYDISFVDEEVCKTAAAYLDERPVDVFTMREATAQRVKDRMIGNAYVGGPDD